MKWINVNESYLDYLRNSESRIPRTDYGDDRYKPFFCILFEKNNLYYITQISHAQSRHKNMKQQKDFYKIYDPAISNRLIAVINLNYMFPIPKSEFSLFEKRKIDTYRTFQSEQEKSKYIDLLDRELHVINSLDLSSKAQYIYNLKYKYPDAPLSRRCLNFKELENSAQKYISEK